MSTSPGYTVGVRAQLSFMMLLEYFIWGSWYVTLNVYMGTNLKASPTQIGAAYGALAIATIISPFFVGLIADKYFSAQRIMGVLHLLGAGLLYFATSITDNTMFYWLVIVYSMLYMPTIALSNSIAFGQMTDPGTQFPWIRVFGTLGWIAQGLIIGFFGWGDSAMSFYLAGGASALLALFSFTLPNTPPKVSATDTSWKSILGLEAFILFKNRSYLIFFISAILICIPLSFYYAFAYQYLDSVGVANAAAKMTMGQVSEAVFILAIPFLFYKTGVKNMLLIGLAAWGLRYIFFAFGDAEGGLALLLLGVIFHGICYDFFFVTGYMYTEKKAGEKIKNKAQGLFTLASYGIGMVIGSYLSGIVVEYYTPEGGTTDWKSVWLAPAYLAGFVFIFFLLFFKEKKQIETAA